MARETRLSPLRVTDKEKLAIESRMRELGYPSVAEYLRALLRADIPGFDPTSKIQKAKHKQKQGRVEKET